MSDGEQKLSLEILFLEHNMVCGAALHYKITSTSQIQRSWRRDSYRCPDRAEPLSIVGKIMQVHSIESCKD